jgi:ethanolamine ammonia-lyase small subunit
MYAVYRGDRQRRDREQAEVVGTASGVQPSDSVVKCQQQQQKERSHQKSSKSRINKRTTKNRFQFENPHARNVVTSRKQERERKRMSEKP